jgi:hypothetical protein
MSRRPRLSGSEPPWLAKTRKKVSPDHQITSENNSLLRILLIIVCFTRFAAWDYHAAHGHAFTGRAHLQGDSLRENYQGIDFLCHCDNAHRQARYEGVYQKSWNCASRGTLEV